MKKEKLQNHRQKWSRCISIALIAVFMLSCNLFSLAQATKITGKVTDASNGEPIVGATILVKGTQNAALTDIDGKYSINADKKSEYLVVSFVGMKTLEIAINGQTVVNASLETNATDIEGVVVTALGIKREKKALGYAVGEVKADAIVNSSETNVVTALSGKVAGVVVNSTSSQAGSGANIIIRGNSSITGSNKPLMVVDGVPYKNDQFGADAVGGETGNTSLDLDLSTVENVSVLKGAAAAALYGSEAANGVIIISTKKGSSGMKPQITFNQSLSFDKYIELPQQHTWAQGNYNSSTGEYMYQDGEPHADGSSGYTSASWGPRISSIPGAKLYDKYEIFQTGTNSETNVNIRGGSDKVAYFTSISNVNQQGLLSEMTLKKTSITSNIDVRVTEKLKVTTGLNFTEFKNNRFWEGFSNSSFMTTFLSQPNTWNPYPTYAEDGTLRSYRGGSRNPYTWLKDNMIRAIERTRFTPNVGMEYNILAGLKLTAKVGIDFYLNNRTDQINSGGYDYPTGLYDVQKTSNFFVNSDIVLSYTKKLSGDFSFDALVGNNIQNTKWEGSSFTGTGFVLPDIYNKNNCATIVPNDWRGQQRSTSLYGQLSLSYSDMLYLTGTARNDWTSTLAPEARMNVYPSTSLAFIFSELISDKKILSFGKASISYSEVGNAPGAYANSFSQDVPWLGWSGFQLPYNGTTGFFPSTTALNPNLQAEKSKELEFDLDTKFLNNRIGLEVSIYKSWSDNQIMNVNLEASSGYSNALMNIGEIQNKGIELLLTGTPVKKKDFSWDIAFNWSKNRTEVIKLGLNGDPISLAYDLYAVEGESFPVIYGNAYVRDANGNMVIDDDPNSGSYGYPLQTNDRRVLGKVEADWQGGMRNTFTYKGFTLGAFIDMRVGGFIESGTDSYLRFYGLTIATENRPENNMFVMDGVKGHYDESGNVVVGGKNDQEVRYDNYWKSYANLETITQKSDFIKLREVSLFYSFPKPILEKMKIVKALSLGFVGRNLWHKYDDSFTGADPEASNFGDNSAQQGLSWYMFPSTKTYTFKLSVTF
jgi:TonB-linked SusC/RagA family outer membrane protein